MPDDRTTPGFRASPITAESYVAHLLPLAISAVLMFLLFPPVGWGILSHVALVPLVLVAVRSQRPWRLGLCAWLVYLVWWSIMLMWIHPVTPGGYVLMGAVLAIYPVLACLLIRLLHRRAKTGLVLIVPLVWVSLELVRDHLILGGFGWFTLAQAISPYHPGHRVPWLLQTADLFGPLTVSFVLAMSNGLICDLLTRPWMRQDASGRPRLGRTVRYATALWLITLVSGLGYGVWRSGESPSANDQSTTVRVAAVQSNSPQSHRNKPTMESIEREWTQQVELTLDAGAAVPRPDLIVWPETFVPAALNAETLQHYRTTQSFWKGSDIFHTQLGSIARSLETHIVTGAPSQFDWQEFESETESGKSFAYEMPTRSFNSVYHYHPDGSQNLQRYDKQHLVAFGEYIPWISGSPTLKQWFIDYLSPYPYDYSLERGRGPTIFQLRQINRLETPPPDHVGPYYAQGIIRFAAPICFEDTVSRVCRDMVYSRGTKRVDLLVNVTNDGWFEGTREPVLHLQASVLRCIELRVPMVRSVNTGITGFIDSTGRVGPLVEVEGKNTSVAGWVAHDVRTDPRETLYGSWGAVPMWCLGALLLLCTAYCLATGKRKAAA